MPECYITDTARFLPGQAIPNKRISDYLGALNDEESVKRRVLRMNGIRQRHFAQTCDQVPTHDIYDLGAAAAGALGDTADVGYLAAGTTHAPLSGPGVASLIHSRLQARERLTHPVEIASHGGICSSASAALVGAVRAVAAGDQDDAISVGAEHASEVLKSSELAIVDDRDQHDDPRDSEWFMTVFLRFMLSDGAGAFRLSNQPSESGLSLRVDWTHSASFAHEAPLCMKLDNRDRRLTQHVPTLSDYMIPTAQRFAALGLERHGESLDDYAVVLPHMSSFYFRDQMEQIIASATTDGSLRPYWTNLATAGNTGAASIYIMLDEYLEQHPPQDGDRIMLFVPESGQFNFVMISLTAVRQ